jgi:hypothetical protein
VPVWTNLVLKLSKAPYITIATIRGRARGGGNELAVAPTCATPAVRKAELDAFVDAIVGPPCAAHAAAASVVGSDVSCCSSVSVSSASG